MSGDEKLLNLTGYRALVCGASQGIGFATAEVLAQMGAQVIMLARTGPKLSELVKNLPGKGHSVLPADLGETQSLSAKIQTLLKAGPIHILVNNAGGPPGGPILNAKAEDFSKAFAQHVQAAQELSSALVPGMKDAKYGRIINIISTSVKAPIVNLGVSNTIRGAMASWSKSMANEMGPYGITVNNVLPGFTSTERLSSLRKATADRLQITEAEVENNWKAAIPMGRFADPKEVARVIGFLASPWASYVSGVNVPVDGGRTPSL